MHRHSPSNFSLDKNQPSVSLAFNWLKQNTILVVGLFLLLIGSASAYFLVKDNQDLRQRAGYSCANISSKNSCETTAGCNWHPSSCSEFTSETDCTDGCSWVEVTGECISLDKDRCEDQSGCNYQANRQSCSGLEKDICQGRSGCYWDITATTDCSSLGKVSCLSDSHCSWVPTMHNCGSGDCWRSECEQDSYVTTELRDCSIQDGGCSQAGCQYNPGGCVGQYESGGTCAGPSHCSGKSRSDCSPSIGCYWSPNYESCSGYDYVECAQHGCTYQSASCSGQYEHSTTHYFCSGQYESGGSCTGGVYSTGECEGTFDTGTGTCMGDTYIIREYCSGNYTGNRGTCTGTMVPTAPPSQTLPTFTPVPTTPPNQPARPPTSPPTASVCYHGYSFCPSGTIPASGCSNCQSGACCKQVQSSPTPIPSADPSTPPTTSENQPATITTTGTCYYGISACPTGKKLVTNSSCSNCPTGSAICCEEDNNFQTECSYGESRCTTGTTYQACLSTGMWSQNYLCPHRKVCKDGECVAPTPTLGNNTTSTQTTNATTPTTSPSNGAVGSCYYGVSACPSGMTTFDGCSNCPSGSAICCIRQVATASQADSCQAGDRECSNDSSQHRACLSDGNWSDWHNCPSNTTCSNGMCISIDTNHTAAATVKKDNYENCSSDTECLSGYCRRVCLPESVANNLMPAKHGEACGGQQSCESGLRCENNICIDKVEAGSECESNGDCVSNYCRDGTCFQMRVNYERCSSDNECLSGYCERGSCLPQSTAVAMRAKLPEGSACDRSSMCQDQLECIDNICQTPPVNYQPQLDQSEQSDDTYQPFSSWADEYSAAVAQNGQVDRPTPQGSSLYDLKCPEGYYIVATENRRPMCATMDEVVAMAQSQRSGALALGAAGAGGLAATTLGPAVAGQASTIWSLATSGSSGGALSTLANLPAAIYSQATATLSTAPGWVQTGLGLGLAGSEIAGTVQGAVACRRDPYSDECLGLMVSAQLGLLNDTFEIAEDLVRGGVRAMHNPTINTRKIPVETMNDESIQYFFWQRKKRPAQDIIGQQNPNSNRVLLADWARKQGVELVFTNETKTIDGKQVRGYVRGIGSRRIYFPQDDSGNPFFDTMIVTHELTHALALDGQVPTTKKGIQFYANECLACRSTIEWLRKAGYPENHPYIVEQYEYWEYNSRHFKMFRDRIQEKALQLYEAAQRSGNWGAYDAYCKAQKKWIKFD